VNLADEQQQQRQRLDQRHTHLEHDDRVHTALIGRDPEMRERLLLRLAEPAVRAWPRVF
jgi:hypothetical protein